MNYFKRNITVDYVFRFLASFDITAGIWVLYLAFRGLSLIEIGILESIFHLTGLIFEIPTGALADLLGRKKIMILGRVALLISCIIMLNASSFFMFAVAFIIQALGYNLNSGSEEALVYDSLKVMNQEEKYLSVQGRLNLIIEIASGLAVFIGGLLSEVSFSLSYTVALLVALTSLGIVCLFKEPPVKQHETLSLIHHFKTCYDVLKSNVKLTGLLLFFPIICTFSTIIYFYGQQFFYEIGFSKVQISLIFLINGLVSAIGALLCTKIEAWCKGFAWLIIPSFIGFSILVFGVMNNASSVILFWMCGFFTSILWPISSDKINALVPSEQRATIISISSMFFSMMMIVLFPLAGVIGQIHNLSVAFLLVGIMNIVFVLLVFIFYCKQLNK